MTQDLLSSDSAQRASAFESLVLRVIPESEHPDPELLAAAFQKLSSGFIQGSGTPLRRGPEMDPVEAYAMGLMFASRTFHVAHYLFGWWPPQAPLFDLGCGWAPISLAASLRGCSTKLADKNPVLRAHAEALLQEAGRTDFEFVRDEHEITRETLGSAVLAFSWNEMQDTTLLERILGRLKPGGRLYLIEPGNQECSTGLGEIRDRYHKRWRVLGPCAGNSPICPMLERPKDWCHFTYNDPMGPLGQAALERAHRNSGSFHASWLVLEKSAPKSADGFTLLSLRERSKAKVVFQVCDAQAVVNLTALRRSREVSEQLCALPRGSLVQLGAGAESKGDGVRLKELKDLKIIRG